MIIGDDQWVIDDWSMNKNFVATYRLLIHDTDNSLISLIIKFTLLITHWLHIDYTYNIMLHILQKVDRPNTTRAGRTTGVNKSDVSDAVVIA